MFCKNCGKEIPNTATFCPYCGASSGNTSANPVVKEVKPSVIFPNMGKWIKAFFSKQVVENLDVVAKDTSLAGLIGLIFEILIAALAVAIIPIKTMSSIYSLVGTQLVNLFIQFFIEFFKQFFFATFIFGALLGFIYIVLAVNHKKVGIKQVLNLMFYATFPIILALGGSFIFSLLFLPLGILVMVILSTPAYIMTIILLYKGLMKLDTFERDPFYSFTLFSMLFAFVVFIIYIISLVTGLGALIGNLASALDDLFETLPYYFY